jgi:7-cyano-7-deazaguanine synthase
MKAVVLVSGGMDSLVTAAKALDAGRECTFLHVTYGQRTAARERTAFDAICDFYRPAGRLVADIAYLKAIGGSALTDSKIPVPGAGAELASPSDASSIPVTYVPFRNAHMIAVATSLAEVRGAGEIWIGATEVDYSGYPDCRREFFDSMERTIDLGTRPETKIEIVTPIVKSPKADVVRDGLKLGAPFELSWSCYEREDAACGRCESCRLRLAAFAAAGAADPILYA